MKSSFLRRSVRCLTSPSNVANNITIFHPSIHGISHKEEMRKQSYGHTHTHEFTNAKRDIETHTCVQNDLIMMGVNVKVCSFRRKSLISVAKKNYLVCHLMRLLNELEAAGLPLYMRATLRNSLWRESHMEIATNANTISSYSSLSFLSSFTPRTHNVR